ncbi:MAG: hypothetical protein ABF651_04245 [Sporolactobacillus sp.]
MNQEELTGNIGHFSFMLGKIINAIGQTPIEGLDEDLQATILLYGSLVQVAAGSLLIDFFTDNPTAQLGIDLTIIGYGTLVFGFIRSEDDPRRLTVQARSGNLKETLGNVVLLSDPEIQQKFYWVIGAIIICLANLLQALGRSEILSQPGDPALFNKSVTRGSWMEALGSAIIMFGYLYETTTGKDRCYPFPPPAYTAGKWPERHAHSPHGNPFLDNSHF